MKTIETDVVVIGGGATGSGTLRDLALRGIKGVLIEKHDIAYGTTGRNHGLLHSGARYAVKDKHSARECISENRILRNIAGHCIEETGGLFVSLPDDDPQYHEELIKGCAEAGIDFKEISVNEALNIEPNLNPEIRRAMTVPDGTVDPFRLAASNVVDAAERGAQVLNHTQVTSLILGQDGVTGVKCYDKKKKEEIEVHAKLVINATGVWGQQICDFASIPINYFPSKGSMVIIDYRINNIVINRSRKPADGDIFVPGDTVSLIGTTSRNLTYDRIEELTVDDDEIEVLLSDGEQLIPNVSNTRVLRAYCGVRPLISLSPDVDGRDISRGIVLVDHEERDGVKGLLTIAGGKLMTYRLMAEQTVDLACVKLGVDKKCTTHLVPLPGSEKKVSDEENIRNYPGISESVVSATYFRHGERIHSILNRDKRSYGLICECEMVTAGEVEYALKNLFAKDITDLRRRTRVGMGPCQGELCAYRAAGLMAELGNAEGVEAADILREFLEERFKGTKPILWGDALREFEFTYWVYQSLLGLSE